jgi:LmbE family N-acetylglucosaminyl deacetylase
VRLSPTVVRLLARGKPHVPLPLWPVLHTLASAGGTAPLVADPEPVPTLVVCAHPDDELGCAGTLALLAAAGTRLRVVYATDGGATRGSPHPAAVTEDLRREEARRACAALGLPEAPVTWGLPDGRLPDHAPRLAELLRREVAEFGPARVLVPWFLDGHADHRAVSAAVVDADLPAGLEVWGFECWTPLTANRLVDVTATWPRKQAAAACHVTAALAFDLEASLALSRWRSLSGLQGRGYGEAFLALPADAYRGLAEQTGDRVAAQVPAQLGRAG